MNTSKIVLLAGLGTVIVLILGGLIVMRVALVRESGAGKLPGAVQSIGDRGSWIEKSYEFEDFQGVRAEGAWHVRLARADAYGIRVRAPESMAGRVQVRKQADLLVLSWTAGTRYTGRSLEAEVTMPDIRRVEAAGAADIGMSGFDEEKLEVKVSGAASLHGSLNRFDDLTLRAAGAAKIRLLGNPIRNAELHLSGASDVELLMSGGRLSGEATGASSIVYEGEVADQSLRVTGVGSVKRR